MMCISPLSDSGLGDFIHLRGRALVFLFCFVLKIQETGRQKSRTEQICQTHFLSEFSANFCSLLPPPTALFLPPPSPILLNKKKLARKICISKFLKGQNKSCSEQKCRCAQAGRSFCGPGRTKQEAKERKCEGVQEIEKADQGDICL